MMVFPQLSNVRQQKEMPIKLAFVLGIVSYYEQLWWVNRILSSTKK